MAAAIVVLLAGACKDDVEPDPQYGTLNLNFALKWGNANLGLSVPTPAVDGRNYRIDELKFYLSRLQLVKLNDSIANLMDVALIDLSDAASLQLTAPVPVGTYKELRFNLGLDYDLNHTDPSNYATNHPMSSTTGMYWTWASRYIFSKIEGQADTTGGHTLDGFLYHSGADSLVRAVALPGLTLPFTADGTTNHTVTVDLQRVFFSATDTIDVAVDDQTHTSDFPAVASRVTNQLAGAFR